MEKLEQMFSRQIDLQKRLGTFDKMKLDDMIKQKQQFINQNAIAAYEEVSEILRCTPYKNPDVVPFGWKKNQSWNLEEYKGEVVDLMHFVMNFAIVVGMGPQEFYDIYMEKNDENFKRQERNY